MDSNNQGSIGSSNAAISTGTATGTTTGTATTTTTTTTITSNETNVDQRVLVLRLDQNKPNVSFSTDTIDNENMGKKSSKRCCIYHKIKKFAESDSDESDSDTEIAAKAPNQGKPALFQRYHA
jgi:protein phosphatase 1 regulatory subunit 11